MYEEEDDENLRNRRIRSLEYQSESLNQQLGHPFFLSAANGMAARSPYYQAPHVYPYHGYGTNVPYHHPQGYQMHGYPNASQEPPHTAPILSGNHNTWTQPHMYSRSMTPDAARFAHATGPNTPQHNAAPLGWRQVPTATYPHYAQGHGVRRYHSCESLPLARQASSGMMSSVVTPVPTPVQRHPVVNVEQTTNTNFNSNPNQSPASHSVATQPAATPRRHSETAVVMHHTPAPVQHTPIPVHQTPSPVQAQSVESPAAAVDTVAPELLMVDTPDPAQLTTLNFAESALFNSALASVNSLLDAAHETSSNAQHEHNDDSLDSIIGTGVSDGQWQRYFEDGFWRDRPFENPAFMPVPLGYDEFSC